MNIKRFKRYDTDKEGFGSIRVLEAKEHCLLAVEPEKEAFYHLYGVTCLPDGKITWQYEQRLAPENVQIDDILI